MALDYHQLKSAQLPTVRDAYGPDRCILYALGVGAGLGTDSALGDETSLLYEEALETLPAMASVVGYPGFWMRDAQYGLDWRRIVHAEQRLKLQVPLPTTGDLTGHSRVRAICDKGAGKGTVVVIEREIRDQNGALIASVEQLNFCRGDGGYSAGDAALSDPMPVPIERVPSTPPDLEIALPSSRNQAAIYRLCGDRNPLHIDSQVAIQAGFRAPILHGAATAGMANRALRCLQGAGRRDFLRDFQIRFTGVFYPGDTMTVQLWHGQRAVFRCVSAHDASEVAYGSATWDTREPLP